MVESIFESVESVSESDVMNPEPCPYCGSTQVYPLTLYILYEGQIAIHCDNCGAWGPPVACDLKHIKESKNKATEAWNKRVEKEV